MYHSSMVTLNQFTVSVCLFADISIRAFPSLEIFHNKLDEWQKKDEKTAKIKSNSIVHEHNWREIKHTQNERDGRETR